MERDEIVDRLWEKAEPVLYISKEEFVRNLDGWEIEHIEIEGELAFVGVRKGPQFHFQSFGRHNLPLKLFRPYLQKIIDEHGYAETRTPKDDTRQHRFNRRFGFAPCGEDQFDIHYRIEGLPHG